MLTEAVRRIVTVYKDQNERGLARPMAQIMARYLPPRWMGAAPVVTFVPATAAARRRRGFDHAEHLARELSFIAGLDFAPLLVAARSRDQRKLGRTGRIGNMRHSLTALAGASMPAAVIVVDDVCTTGATLFAATEASSGRGAGRPRPFRYLRQREKGRQMDLCDWVRFAACLLNLMARIREYADSSRKARRARHARRPK